MGMMQKEHLDYVLAPLGLSVFLIYHVWLLYTILGNPLRTVIGLNAESCHQWVLSMMSDNLTVAVDDDGCFTDKITDFSGRYIKDADKDIIEAVKVLCSLDTFGLGISPHDGNSVQRFEARDGESSRPYKQAVSEESK